VVRPQGRSARSRLAHQVEALHHIFEAWIPEGEREGHCRLLGQMLDCVIGADVGEGEAEERDEEVEQRDEEVEQRDEEEERDEEDDDDCDEEEDDPKDNSDSDSDGESDSNGSDEDYVLEEDEDEVEAHAAPATAAARRQAMAAANYKRVVYAIFDDGLMTSTFNAGVGRQMGIACNVAVALHLLCLRTRERREWWCKLVASRWGPRNGRTPLDADYECPRCNTRAEDRTGHRTHNRFSGWCTVSDPGREKDPAAERGLHRWRQVCIPCDEDLRKVTRASQSTTALVPVANLALQ